MKLACMFKDPDDTLDYDVDYVRWLDTSDRIVEAKATTQNPHIKIINVEFGDDKAKVWVSEGKPGETVTINMTIKTANGRIKDDCFDLRIRNC